MKALVIARWLHGTGVSTFVRELQSGFPAIGVEPHVWVSDYPGTPPPNVTALRHGFELKLNILEAAPGWFDYRHLGSRQAVNALKPGDYDVIHMNDINGGWFSLIAAEKLCKKAPTVWVHHDESAHNQGFVYELTNRVPKADVMPRLPWLYRMLNYSPYHTSYKSRMNGRFYDRHAPQPTLHICGPQYNADLLVKSGRYNPERVRFLRNGISLMDNPNALIPREKAREIMNLKPGLPVILLMGSDCRDVNKGMHLGAQVLHRVIAKTPFQAIVLGRNVDTIRSLLGSIPAHFEFIRSPDKLAAAYRAADLTVVPSMIETYPHVAIESLGCATPVVSFKVGGFIDILQNGEHGVLIEPYDIAQMADAVSALLTNLQRANALGETGARWVRRNCSNKALVTTLKGYYQEAQELFKQDSGRNA